MIRKIIRPLLQEIYQDDGWKMLTCCMLLNLTNRKQVDTIRDELFKKYPTPKDMMNAKHRELDEKIKVLESEQVGDDIIKRQKQQKLQLKDEITKIQTDIENLDE